MARDGYHNGGHDRLDSPEEHGEGYKRPSRGGREARHEGGFAEGEMGRGPNPYKLSHSSKPKGHSMHCHMSDTGRGGGGVIGKGDSFKGYSEDIAHPQSHADFEALGTED